MLVVLGGAVNVHVSKRYFMLHTDIFNGGSMACESLRVCTQVNKGHCMDPSRLVTLQSCAATCTHLLTSPILRAAQTLKTSATQQNKTTQNFRHIRQQKHRAYIKWYMCVSACLRVCARRREREQKHRAYTVKLCVRVSCVCLSLSLWSVCVLCEGVRDITALHARTYTERKHDSKSSTPTCRIQ